MRCPDKCNAKLRHAEAKRIPRSALYLHGYYIGCPSCGLPQAVTVFDVAIAEEGPLVSIERIVCGSCGCCYRIDRDEVTILRAGRAA